MPRQPALLPAGPATLLVMCTGSCLPPTGNIELLAAASALRYRHGSCTRQAVQLAAQRQNQLDNSFVGPVQARLAVAAETEMLPPD